MLAYTLSTLIVIVVFGLAFYTGDRYRQANKRRRLM